MASATPLCLFTVKMNAQKFKSRHQTAVNLNYMYVNDLATGTSDIIGAKQMVDQLKINSYRQCQLQKWCSYIPEVISHIPNELFNNKDIILLLDGTNAPGIQRKILFDC
ncbi:unnamed protein product [Lepeophtheirus salmonis]|uniref:(salmon louse) hypothetical protein n=1 Tax=Lepeophtheirus salmonis TaxID=72036 RepID=A0A7R8D249_LEPSM|nr:unnamed protein product [Lepeophtheirus salmonis]CAF2973952.1 unnamed protein product [Lepeophtheirus salmonis]